MFERKVWLGPFGYQTPILYPMFIPELPKEIPSVVKRLVASYSYGTRDFAHEPAR